MMSPKASRGPTSVPPTDTPGQDPISHWMQALTTHATETNARLEALEKSIDQLIPEVRRGSDALEKTSKAAAILTTSETAKWAGFVIVTGLVNWLLIHFGQAPVTPPVTP